jgi:DNA-binding winged helix-turn-helix (wHTH) protein/TolB-like protein/Flp pilus assembly protein TadD
MSGGKRHIYEFGPFRVDADRHLLLREGQTEPLPLTPKAFDTLLLLVRNSGLVLGKDEMMRALWPDTFVEENNLERNVSMLRKALGEGPHERRYIVTVPRRGYRFAAPVTEHWDGPEDYPGLVIRERAKSSIFIEEVEETEGEAGAAHEVKGAAGGMGTKKAKAALRVKVLAACLVLAASLAIASYLRRPEMPSPAESGSGVRSIAVLPFTPLDTGGDEFLGLGMADTLITRLGSASGVIVRPTSAVREYPKTGQDPVAAGAELGVDAVLEGSIQRSGDRLRVTVRLLRVKDGKSLWADAFDEQSADIFKVQDSISERVVGALALKLSGAELKLLTKRNTEDAEAYQLYLKGRYFWNKRTEEGLKKGVEYFQQAIERDPAYALAYTGLADSYSMLGDYTGLQREFYLKAKAAAVKALEMDDNLAEAHASLAYLGMRHEGNWSDAGKALRRAIEIRPNYATAHHWYSIYLELMGQEDEALREARRAQEIDPLSPIISQNLADRLYLARHYELAVEESRKALEMDPTFAASHVTLGYIYVQQRKYEEAIAEYQEAERLDDDPETLAGLGYAYAASGKMEKARKVLADMMEVSRSRHVPPEAIAKVHLGLGEKEQALSWLEKAYEDRSNSSLVFVKVDPLWDSLRSDTRFNDLLRRLGLTQ